MEKEYEDSLLVMDDFDMNDDDEVSVESETKQKLANDVTGVCL